MEIIKFTLPWLSSGDWITQGRKELKIERCNTLASKSHPRQKNHKHDTGRIIGCKPHDAFTKVSILFLAGWEG